MEFLDLGPDNINQNNKNTFFLIPCQHLNFFCPMTSEQLQSWNLHLEVNVRRHNFTSYHNPHQPGAIKISFLLVLSRSIVSSSPSLCLSIIAFASFMMEVARKAYCVVKVGDKVDFNGIPKKPLLEIHLKHCLFS